MLICPDEPALTQRVAWRTRYKTTQRCPRRRLFVYPYTPDCRVLSADIAEQIERPRPCRRRCFIFRRLFRVSAAALFSPAPRHASQRRLFATCSYFAAALASPPALFRCHMSCRRPSSPCRNPGALRAAHFRRRHRFIFAAKPLPDAAAAGRRRDARGTRHVTPACPDAFRVRSTFADAPPSLVMPAMP